MNTRRDALRPALTAVLALTLAAGLTGCGPDEPSDAELQHAAQRSTADGEFLEKTFPDLARSMGADSLTRLRERTCTGALPGDPAAVENTSWVAEAKVTVRDKHVARTVADHVRDQARTQGWELADDPADVDADGNFSGTRLLGGHHHERDLALTVLLDEDRHGDLIVTALVRGACRDMPTDHRMVRSTLDPEYGAVGSGYEDTGDLHDYTGRYKPLPDSTQDPAPTGPTGATPRGGIDG